jgi:hypothetical protein
MIGDEEVQQTIEIVETLRVTDGGFPKLREDQLVVVI